MFPNLKRKNSYEENKKVPPVSRVRKAANVIDTLEQTEGKVLTMLSNRFHSNDNVEELFKKMVRKVFADDDDDAYLKALYACKDKQVTNSLEQIKLGLSVGRFN